MAVRVMGVEDTTEVGRGVALNTSRDVRLEAPNTSALYIPSQRNDACWCIKGLKCERLYSLEHLMRDAGHIDDR